MKSLLTRVFAACAFSALLLARAGVGGEMGELSVGEHAARHAVQAGAWGGEHISLQVTGGGAAVEFDCGRAVIPRPLVLDRRGRFDAEGTYYEERGGPARQGEQAAGQRARFTGRVRGSEMRLAVTLTEEKEVIGNFVLTRGREPALVKCR